MNRITTEWISEVKFYSEDLKFVQHITDCNLMEMVAHENLDEVREGIMRLQDITSECQAMEKALADFQGELAQSTSGKFTADLAKEHTAIHQRIARLRANFYTVKNEIFGIAEHVLAIRKKDKSDLIYELLRTTNFEN